MLHVGRDDLRIGAPVARPQDLVDELGVIDDDALLLLEGGLGGTEALPGGAALGHLLDHEDLRTLLGGFETRHDAADAGADDEHLGVGGGYDFVIADGAVFEGHRSVGAGAFGVAHRQKRCVLSQGLGVRVGRCGCLARCCAFLGEGHAGPAERQGPDHAGGSRAFEEVAPR